MGLDDVIRQHAAGGAAGSDGMQSPPAPSGGSPYGGGNLTDPNAQSPSVSMMQNGTTVQLNAVTLILYGVALADLLLLYIALRV